MNFVQKCALNLIRELPQTKISHWMGQFMQIENPQLLSRLSIRTFAKLFNVAVCEAEKPLADYSSLSEFFTRRLKPGLRPIDTRPRVLTSPCDGVIGEFGRINNSTLVQAKGRYYQLHEFVGGKKEAEIFESGYYVTIYLSPRHYHRVHTPVSGRLIKSTYFPGLLLPVNQASITHHENVFVKNERLLSYLQSPLFGMVAVSMVGAFGVGHMSVTYDGLSFIGQRNTGHLKHKNYVLPHQYQKAEELGTFHLGSTVVLLCQSHLFDQVQLKRGQEVKMGQCLLELSSHAKT